MPRYLLVAARDGDVIYEAAEWPDEGVAQAWATGLMALTFNLDPEEFVTFDDIAPETDGCELVELEPDPIAEVAIEVVDAISARLAIFDGSSLLRKDDKYLVVAEAATKLARTLISAGYKSRTSA